MQAGTARRADDFTVTTTNWRDILPVHPAADLFPLMSESELRELGEDIKANGLRASIVLYEGKLLDGRNRLDAMELVGVEYSFLGGTDPTKWSGLGLLRTIAPKFLRGSARLSIQTTSSARQFALSRK